MSDRSESGAPQPQRDLQSQPLSVSMRMGRLQFHLSGKFRVLQITDIQDGPMVSKDTIRLIEAACDAARPDLVVFTGDQIAGYDPAFIGTFRKRRWTTAWDGVYAVGNALGRSVGSLVDSAVKGHSAKARSGNGGKPTDASQLSVTMNLVRRQAAQFLAPLIKRGIPFAITYGNHDFQCGLETSQLDAIYREFPGCLNPEVVAGDGSATRRVRVPNSGMPGQTAFACEPGTFALPVVSPHGHHQVIGIALADSGDYEKSGGYGLPSETAVKWLGRVPALLGTKSILFQHIPLPQFYHLLREVPAATAYAIQGYRMYDSKWYVLDEEKTLPGGYMGEGVSCPDTDGGEYKALKDSGGYFAIFSGHDHRNAFVGTDDGMMMGMTPTSGFGSYGPPSPKRAARLIEFDIRHPFNPRTQLLEFGDLVGRPSEHRAYTFAMGHLPKSPSDAVNLLHKPGVRKVVISGLSGVKKVMKAGANAVASKVK